MTPFDNAIAIRSQYESNKKKVKSTELKDALDKMEVTGAEKVNKAKAYQALCHIIALRDSGLIEVVEYNHLEAQYQMMMIVEPEVVEEVVVEPEPIPEPEIVEKVVVEKPAKKKATKKAKSKAPKLGDAIMALLQVQEDGSSLLESSLLTGLGLNVLMCAESWGLTEDGESQSDQTSRPNDAQKSLMKRFKSIEIMDEGIFLYPDESGVVPNFRKAPRRYDWASICLSLYEKHLIEGTGKALITRANSEAECGNSKYIRSSSWTDFNDCCQADNGMYKGAKRAGLVGQCLKDGRGNWVLYLWPVDSDCLPGVEDERGKIKARKSYREAAENQEEKAA